MRFIQNSFGEKEMIRTFISIALVAALMWSCTSRTSSNSKQSSVAEPDSTYIPHYAKGFVINYFEGYSQIVLNDPWGDSTKTETIALVRDESKLKVLKAQNDFVLKYPVSKWVALSSTMVNYAHALGVKHTIKGVAEPQYIADDYLQEAIASGQVKNVGLAVAPDVEIMVDIEPDFMMVSPFKDNHFKAVESAGIPVITNADYLEHTPLGRAEWLVFVGELLGEGSNAKHQFEAIEKEYLAVKAKVSQVEDKPSVFTGHIYQGIWYTPAGQSYMANFFNDAGCNYIYNDTEGTGSLSLDYETIIDKAEHTDFWVLIINYPTEVTYKEIETIDKRYTDFDAYKNKQVVVTNSSHSRYFEKGLLQPHVVLSDLAHAFHPALLPDYDPLYFQLINK
ncbi:ABC transporter substrate-binding protein [Carboxylicivirga mesophila]|uniref:ABC transporter substrate-binding protein n=1 Tax=Carboxylicivirga mesophila TaxID=1166478 RepID=A0ABS5KDH7_9BACT|nr:ABC transporter substrate-binding protein [Carboxylicivirga mesophila]MBS2212403.1 ABC transporter substrate-binding protein [Carboxylicivirga mesophila]